MKWNKYSIQTTTEAVDFISSMLGELGIEGIEIEDNVQLTQEEAKTMFVDFIPDLPPDDGSAKVNFYIDSDEDDNTIMDKVKDGLEELRLFCNVGAGTISESQTEDKDWINNWKQYWHTFTIGDLYIKPTWEPLTEDAPIKPATSPYGNTKQINEEIIRDTIHANAPFKSIILRYFNPIGAHPSAEIGELPNGVPQNLIPYLTQTAIGIRKELSVFGDDYDTPDGSCIRDYINVVDLAKAHVIAMDRMLGGKTEENVEYFNLGTGNGVTVLELINTFEKATGVKVPHKIVGRREGDIEKVWANPERANKVLGWTAKETLSDTLASAWKWQEKLRERGIQ